MICSNFARHEVGVGARPDDVVAARRDRDEVGLQRQRRLDLLVEDLLDELAAHGEIAVGEVVGALGEHLGDAIGPAAMATGSARLRIADALGERVAQGHVARPGMLGTGIRFTRHGSSILHTLALAAHARSVQWRRQRHVDRSLPSRPRQRPQAATVALRRDTPEVGLEPPGETPRAVECQRTRVDLGQ